MNERAIAGGLALTGLDGTNPLGFLAALGTLWTARALGEQGVRLRFVRRATWVPVIEGVTATAPEAFSESIARGLKGREVDDAAEQRRVEAERAFDAAKKAFEAKRKEIAKRGVRGKERDAVIAQELDPLAALRDQARDVWLAALAEAVPRPELALGKRIDCSDDEYRDHAATLGEGADVSQREALDLLAAFGSDACLAHKSNTIVSTPFCFITGSGHQYFLDTARQLMERVTADRVREALFEPWTYRDDGLSMRWDPIDDRRYALMDRDPGPIGSQTVWMANLLAYRAMALFTAAPRPGRLRVTGWSLVDDAPVFSWPIWDFGASPDVVRSLLQLRELKAVRPDRAQLRARGVMDVFHARRIKVGAGANYKLNFTPGRAV